MFAKQTIVEKTKYKQLTAIDHCPAPRMTHAENLAQAQEHAKIEGARLGALAASKNATRALIKFNWPLEFTRIMLDVTNNKDELSVEYILLHVCINHHVETTK